MKIVRPIICLTFLIFVTAAFAGEDYPFYRHVSFWGATNQWFLSESRLEKMPRWNEKGEPPIGVGKAISLAKAWVVSLGGSTNCFVTSVQFRPLDPGAPASSKSRFRSFWFYVIDFQEVAMVGSHVTCVVLLDGSVLGPRLRHEPKKKSILDYLD